MNYSLDKNGFEVFTIKKSLKKAVSNEIRKNISKKLNIKLNSSYSLISKNINLISDKQFKQLFGFVSLRYLSKEITNRINNYLKLNKLNKNYKKISLHYLSKSDLIHNNDLKINQYCVYYRVVRKEKKDVSFPHRDSDFWKAHRYDKNLVPKVPFKYLKRFKVWFPVYGCKKQNSLRFFNFSHKHKISTRYVSKNGYKKPKISKKYINQNFKNIVSPINNYEKDALIFDDNIVHFAPKNNSTNLRISCEFTILTK